MNFQKRKLLILSLLHEHGSLEVADLAHQLGVSDITIRRDLTLLAEEKLLLRTRGGAMSLNAVSQPVKFLQKAVVRSVQKEYIARLASRYIQESDVVFLDCGSTVMALAPFLTHRRIKVITNSLPLAHALLNSSVELNLIGGEVDSGRMAIHGPIGLEHIARYRASKAFVGVDGVSLERGLTANSEREAAITLAMVKQSSETFLLCDSSKLEKDKYLQFAPLSIIDHLITDEDASDDLLDQYRKVVPDVVNG